MNVIDPFENDVLVSNTDMRKPWPLVWMKFARQLAEDRSGDERLKVGTIIVPEDNTGILSLGYNGNYKGGPNRSESLEPGKSGAVHSEINALIKCDFNYPKRKIMYVTHFPCTACSKAIINANIFRVVYDNVYRDMTGKAYFEDAGVEVFSLEDLLLTL